MAELRKVNLKNEVIGKENADDSIFKTSYKPYLLHDYVVMQRRALRQGTHSTKTRAEVSGTGKKPFRQKGTGRARQGTLIGPHQPGGGIQFGPRPRDYTTKLNKKTKLEALRVAFSQKNFEGKLAVLDSFESATGKTKDTAKSLAPFIKTSVLVIGNLSDATKRSFRNLPNAKCLSVDGLNVADLLRHDHVLITKDALSEIVAKLSKAERKAA